jgi:hypothetical protein
MMAAEVRQGRHESNTSFLWDEIRGGGGERRGETHREGDGEGAERSRVRAGKVVDWGRIRESRRERE